MDCFSQFFGFLTASSLQFHVRIFLWNFVTRLRLFYLCLDEQLSSIRCCVNPCCRDDLFCDRLPRPWQISRFIVRALLNFNAYNLTIERSILYSGIENKLLAYILVSAIFLFFFWHIFRILILRRTIMLCNHITILSVLSQSFLSIKVWQVKRFIIASCFLLI